MAFTEDLSQFLDTDDFGVAATYNGSTTVNGIFDNGFSVDGGETPIAGTSPTFMCRTADVPSAAEGDTLVISSVSYTVVCPRPDGTGMTLLQLQES